MNEKHSLTLTERIIQFALTDLEDKTLPAIGFDATLKDRIRDNFGMDFFSFTLLIGGMIRNLEKGSLFQVPQIFSAEQIEKLKAEWEKNPPQQGPLTFTPAPPAITGETSDGYHTFNELYEHRHMLFIALCKQLPEHAWKSRLHSDGTMFEGWFVMGLYLLPGEQITYHLPMSHWNLTPRVCELEHAPEWDGHTPDDSMKRLISISLRVKDRAAAAPKPKEKKQLDCAKHPGSPRTARNQCSECMKAARDKRWGKRPEPAVEKETPIEVPPVDALDDLPESVFHGDHDVETPDDETPDFETPEVEIPRATRPRDLKPPKPDKTEITRRFSKVIQCPKCFEKEVRVWRKPGADVSKDYWIHTRDGRGPDCTFRISFYKNIQIDQHYGPNFA